MTSHSYSLASFPLVSVIVPVYNAAKFLRETLESILGQTYTPFEIIAVNDGSTDSSLKILEEYAHQIQCIHQENQGVAIARNVGVEWSLGSYVAFCDADDIWFPRKLEWQMDIVKRHPCVGVVAGFMEKIDELGRTLDSGQKPSDLYDQPRNLKQVLLMEGNLIGMSTSLIRKEIFQEIGGFQPGNKDLKAEDYDLWIRAAGKTKIYLSSKYVGQYRVLKHSRSHGSLRKEYGAQFQLLRMYRNEYSSDSYKIRKAKIYAEWADSSFFQGESHAWKLQKKAITLHPTHLSYYFRFSGELIKMKLKRLLRNFQEMISFRKDMR
ncbi:glycosyltransferase family 2 protein [Candidatus Nitrospira allomarina]|uniref:Glycosyltransferase family A protein n=1 Tax=Candidatus Nitrospira allomarina TaxID=3020900 RepID=A0AA96GCZ9_9BACT|nr:glycosyltransferase family A protein [Candidatus Nitrospira allomarina]WNM57925.1 glycosyltransferase family A protein [Candidatus Nitrospira allomarina]